jgi:aspartate kinase
MALIAQKFGGTSLGDVERIRNVARRVVDTKKAGHDVAVVVSAMAGETDRLVGLAHQVSPDPNPQEYDVLVSTGEQQTIALLAMAIQALGVPARSFTGAQVRVRTDDAHSRARIASIDTERIRAEFARGGVAVVAGFQGIDAEGDITTLGRGGSDTSAIALAAALKADVCEIYTDVDGVFTSDPNVVPTARKLDRISYDEMLELASLGAKVLQIRAVKLGKGYDVPIHVRNTFSEKEGTWVVPESEIIEKLVVSGVAYNRNEAKITVFGVSDRPGIAVQIFTPISEAGIVVDMIVQNVSTKGHTDVTFTVPRTDLERALPIVKRVADELEAAGVTSDSSIAKVSVVGLGMRDHAGVAGRMFQVLADEGINIQMISTSEIKISIVIEEKYTELACRTLHDAFGLGLDQPPAVED